MNLDSYSEAELDSLDLADRYVKWGNGTQGGSSANAAYLQALSIYEAILEDHPDDLYVRFKTGIIHMKTDGHYQKAIDYISRVKKKRPDMIEVNLSLAEAYHQGKKFEKATALLDSLEKRERLRGVWRRKVNVLREDLANARSFYDDPRDVAISNIGGPVNSEGAEYVPVISSDESILIFTYRGEKSIGGRQDWNGEPSEHGVYYEDIFMSRKGEDGNWLPPEPIESLNDPGYNANVALSPSGQKLFVYEHTATNSGDIYVSSMEGKEWSEARKLKGDINQDDSWEGSASMASNGQVLYFSSDRKGGFGGRDLYKAQLMEDSTWGNVQNMGPRVNTEGNEDAPFIHPENTALFYSSTGHNSMGGYDIFRSDLKNGEWSKPVNLGAPVNTPNDDIYYVISADGKRGYYSSGKPGGKGRHDIYVVEPGYIHDNPSLVLYKGEVNFCNEPVEANIQVLQEHDGEELAYYTSNSSSGKFLLNLPSGKSYNIRFKLKGEGLDPITKNVNAIEIDSFVQIQDRIDFYTKECRPDSLKEVDIEDRKAPSDSGKLVLKIEKRKIGEIDTSTSVDMEYEEIVKQYGEMRADGLEFKVQVAAYRHPENYDYSHLTELGDVIDKDYKDGITRFYMDKSFKTLNEADRFLKEVWDAGQLDAFVIAFLEGERTYLKELVPAIEM